ncbi:MAG TPA: heme exporter protein CcmD [Gammaproteobacteria bacterium]|jgi:heme exporter protein D
MSSLHEFLSMGGYGAFVWPAYGLAAMVVVVNIVLPLKRLRRLKADIRRRQGIAS